MNMSLNLNVNKLKEAGSNIKLQSEINDGPHTVTIKELYITDKVVGFKIDFANGYTDKVFESTQEGVERMITKLGLQNIFIDTSKDTTAGILQPIVGKSLVIIRSGIYSNLPNTKQLENPDPTTPTSTNILGGRPRR